MKPRDRKVAALCLLLASSAAGATVLTLSASPAYERQLDSNVHLQSPDAQSPCPSDPGCPGQHTGQGMMPVPANDMNSPSSAAAGAVDDVFLSPAGSRARTYPTVPTYVIDAADNFDDEQELKWKVKLRLLQTYTSMRALVSLIDTGQGDAGDAGNIASGLYHKMSMADNIASGRSHEISAAGAMAAGMSGLCVARDGSYNTVGASGQKDCPAGSIYVSAKRSVSMAEYAAYLQSVNNPARGAATSNSLHWADLRYSRNEPGLRQYRRCSDCDANPTGAQEPGLLQRILGWLQDPVSMLLVALAVGAALVADAVTKARRA